MIHNDSALHDICSRRAFRLTEVRSRPTEEDGMMKGMIRTALGGAAVAVLAACGSAGPAGGGGSPTPLTFTVPLYDAQGQEVARATMTQAGRDTVHLSVDATHL